MERIFIEEDIEYRCLLKLSINKIWHIGMLNKYEQTNNSK